MLSERRGCEGGWGGEEGRGGGGVFFFPAEDGIRDYDVTGVQTCALPIWKSARAASSFSVTLDSSSAAVIVISYARVRPSFKVSVTCILLPRSLFGTDEGT